MGHHFSLDRERKSEYHMFVIAKATRKRQLVLIRARVHPFPSRTRKLSSLLPTILGWRRPGKIGNANTKRTSERMSSFFLLRRFGMESHRRDRSVKSASARDTWQADGPGKIGNANTKRTFERTSSFFLLRRFGMENCAVASARRDNFYRLWYDFIKSLSPDGVKRCLYR